MSIDLLMLKPYLVIDHHSIPKMDVTMFTLIISAIYHTGTIIELCCVQKVVLMLA